MANFVQYFFVKKIFVQIILVHICSNAIFVQMIWDSYALPIL